MNAFATFPHIIATHYCSAVNAVTTSPHLIATQYSSAINAFTSPHLIATQYSSAINAFTTSPHRIATQYSSAINAFTSQTKYLRCEADLASSRFFAILTIRLWKLTPPTFYMGAIRLLEFFLEIHFFPLSLWLAWKRWFRAIEKLVTINFKVYIEKWTEKQRESYSVNIYYI